MRVAGKVVASALLIGASTLGYFWFFSDKGERPGMPEKQVEKVEPLKDIPELKYKHPGISIRPVYETVDGEDHVVAYEYGFDYRTTGIRKEPLRFSSVEEGLSFEQRGEEAEKALLEFDDLCMKVQKFYQEKYRTKRSLVPQDIVKILDKVDSKAGRDMAHLGTITRREIKHWDVQMQYEPILGD